MHAANICTKNYANGKKSQVKTTWRSRLPTQTASTSSSALLRACSPPAFRSYSVRVPPARRLHSGRTHQPAPNR